MNDKYNTKSIGNNSFINYFLFWGGALRAPPPPLTLALIELQLFKDSFEKLSKNQGGYLISENT